MAVTTYEIGCVAPLNTGKLTSFTFPNAGLIKIERVEERPDPKPAVA